MKKLFLLLSLLNLAHLRAQTSTFSAADSLFRIGKYAEAISVYKKIESPPAQIYVKMAQAYRAQGNLGNALEHYKFAIAENKQLPQVVSDYGKLLYSTHKFKKSDSVFQVLVHRFPDNPDFHYQLGLAKKQVKDSTALQQFQETFFLDPHHQKAIYQLALYQFKQKNYEQVEKLGKKALESYAENVKIISLLGQNAMRQEDYSLVIKRFKKLLSLKQTSVFVYKNLAVAYFYRDELKKALAQYQHVLALDRKNVTAYLNSGKIYTLLENYQKAEDFLAIAIKLKKRGLDEFYQAMGMNFKSQKMYGKAIHSFKRALKENPKNIRAQYELAVASDNYYKALQTQLNYYKIFVHKFKENPQAKAFMPLVYHRIDQLKTEIFMQGKMSK